LIVSLMLFSSLTSALEVAVSINSPSLAYAGEVVPIDVRIFNTGAETLSGDISVQIEDISTLATIKFVDLLPGAEQRDKKGSFVSLMRQNVVLSHTSTVVRNHLLFSD